MTAILAGCLGLITASPSIAEPLPSPVEILKSEGQFVFSDGSSYYQFKKDGTFDSGPLSLSGRTIHGTWAKGDASVFIVSGQWGWVNGLSSASDYRRLTMAVYTPTGVEPKSEHPNFPTIAGAKIYKCYFVIEELVKTKKPQ